MNKTKFFLVSIGCGSVLLNGFLFFKLRNMDLCSPHEGRWYRDAVQATGQEVSYPILAGTWCLTRESIRSLKEMLKESSGAADPASTLLSENVTPYTLMLMLSGRHVTLYDTPVLIGASDRWSSLRYFGDVYGQPYKSVLTDSIPNGPAPSSLGFGIDLPVNAITWELKMNHTAPDDAAEKGKNWLVVKTETMPDIWVPIYYEVVTTGGHIRLRSRLSLDKASKKVMLEWMKVDHYAPAS